MTGRAEVMDAVAPGGLGGTFGGHPLSCAAACAVLDEIATPAFRTRAEALGERIRARLEAIAGRMLQIGEVRGLGPMLALEFEEQTPDLARAATAAARERGLVLLSCGTYGNVVRILVPLMISDADLDEGLEILEDSLGDAGAAAG